MIRMNRKRLRNLLIFITYVHWVGCFTEFFLQVLCPIEPELVQAEHMTRHVMYVMRPSKEQGS